ncbi:hypothetical protein QVD17_17568 [Tagetes erecta]|uniref:Secreted protein n=1 Tax=Tagetes erecta TaxID=13708 RepID=A0AAD8KTG6_TARER|nr:hypothetical protein QVD17_17568 [Tagetes erecta]
MFFTSSHLLVAAAIHHILLHCFRIFWSHTPSSVRVLSTALPLRTSVKAAGLRLRPALSVSTTLRILLDTSWARTR